MSLRPQPIGSIPEQTAHIAHAAFPKGHPYLTLRDHLGTIFQDEDFAAMFPAWGYPGLPPWRLAPPVHERGEASVGGTTEPAMIR